MVDIENPENPTEVVAAEATTEESVLEKQDEGAEPVQEETKPEVIAPKTYTEEEYQGLQRIVSKKDLELKAAKAQGGGLSSVGDRLANVEDALGILLENLQSGQAEEEFAPPKPQRRADVDEWQERRKSVKSPAQVVLDGETRQFMDAATKAGIDVSNAETREFFSRFNTPSEALEHIDEYADKQKGAKNTAFTDAVKTATEPMQKEIADLKKLLKETGVTAVETGGPSAKSNSGDIGAQKVALQAGYNKGEIPYAEYLAKWEALTKVQRK